MSPQRCLMARKAHVPSTSGCPSPEVLARGGMGIVFLAEDVHLRRKVALKVMLPGQAAMKAARERFLREAQSAAAIENDHIVHINQVGEDRGVPFLAMQLLNGESLEA